MVIEHSLRIHYTRFGALVEPIIPTIQFDYNHVYNSVSDVITDFKLHGWEMVNQTNDIYTFQKVV